MFIELSCPLLSETITIKTDNILSITPRLNDPWKKNEKHYIDLIFDKPIRNKEDEYALEHCLIYETEEERDNKYSELKKLIGVNSI